ncbi:MarR family winged helix-turn-helix transcriptional regulator [Carboxylicivirga sp. RSCT41]|uniref:MarR family winged helix-turn-helix transcriptional regulator n=1 Tax=Carboxylicivirga agarovorans TaxID=3417570 RepID=UPI003D346777
MAYEQLKLENQLCFPVYAASRLITREYQPHLDRLGITYPQYLVFMLLWEKDERSVNEITQKLILNTNTVTPLLKRMEKQGFITRSRSPEDSRKVIIKLSSKGLNLQEEAALIPESLVKKIAGENIDMDALKRLKKDLDQLIDLLNK